MRFTVTATRSHIHPGNRFRDDDTNLWRLPIYSFLHPSLPPNSIVLFLSFSFFPSFFLSSFSSFLPTTFPYFTSVLLLHHLCFFLYSVLLPVFGSLVFFFFLSVFPPSFSCCLCFLSFFLSFILCALSLHCSSFLSSPLHVSAFPLFLLPYFYVFVTSFCPPFFSSLLYPHILPFLSCLTFMRVSFHASSCAALVLPLFTSFLHSFFIYLLLFFLFHVSLHSAFCSSFLYSPVHYKVWHLTSRNKNTIIHTPSHMWTHACINASTHTHRLSCAQWGHF